MGLDIPFSFVSSQLGFARALQSFPMHASSYLLPNLANVDR